MELASATGLSYDGGMSPQDLKTGRIVRLKVTLDWIKPSIWRRIEVPADAPLTFLHEAIQAAMLFENYHLFAFEAGPRRHETRYAIPDPDGDFTPTMDVRRVRLAELIDAGIERFTYTYDFGDDWLHTIVVEDIAQADPSLGYPRFLTGTNRAPPEDVGGVPGFEHFLAVMADPAHPEHGDLTSWYGRPFDPKDISEAEINRRLGKLAKSRTNKRSAKKLN